MAKAKVVTTTTRMLVADAVFGAFSLVPASASTTSVAVAAVVAGAVRISIRSRPRMTRI